MRIPRQPSANPRDGARPLFVTADPVLAEAVCRVAAEADVGLDVVNSATAVRGRWRGAPVVLVGDDLAAELARAALPRRDGVVLVGRDLDDGSVWQRGTALGARQVLILPDAERWLAGLLADAVGEDGPGGPIVAVLPGRGGAGASTLAAALAMTATRRNLRTTLVDLDPIGGGIDLLFGLETAPGPRWSELVQWRDGRLCGRSLRAALPSYRCAGRAGTSGDSDSSGSAAVGLPILTRPRTRGTTPALPIESETARSVLHALSQAGDLVVVDLPRHLDEASIETLSVATATLLVIPAEVRAAAASAQLASAARLVTTGDLRAVVRMPSPGDLAPAEIADVVGLPLAGVIGPDKRMAAAAEHGEPPGTAVRGSLAGFCRPYLEQLMGGRRHPAWAGQDRGGLRVGV